MGEAEEQVVRDFLKFAEGKDQNVEELTKRMTDDVVWQVNVPLSKQLRGREAARQELARQNTLSTGLLSGSQLVSIGSNDTVVFTERVDSFEMAGKAITLHINGVFELRHGKIAAWREYFDSNDLASQLDIDASVLYR